MLDFSHAWLPYIYQYVFGGLIFVVGIVLTYKAGSFYPAHPRHGKWLIILLLGFVWFLVLHGGMILAALGHEWPAFISGAVIMTISSAVAMFWNRRISGGA